MPEVERCFCRACSRCVIDVVYGAAAFLLVPVIYHTEKNYGILIAMELWEKKEAMMRDLFSYGCKTGSNF